ncbi:MAG: hypothetical protein L3J35_03055 [Bacteroidales bacterium]|nr:hypothetical protein [Bacteroidales bacterium]
MKINNIFFSDKTGNLFEKCVFCEGNILKYENGYVIEKAFKYNEKTKSFKMIFEYALCSECIKKLSSEMSKESTEKIQNYLSSFRSNLNVVFDNEAVIEERLKTCMVKNKNVQTSEEYQIAGFFLKDKMLVSDMFPYAVGDEAIEEIQNLISEKTRDFSNKFKDLILPPDVREKFPKDRVVIF